MASAASALLGQRAELARFMNKADADMKGGDDGRAWPVAASACSVIDRAIGVALALLAAGGAVDGAQLPTVPGQKVGAGFRR